MTDFAANLAIFLLTNAGSIYGTFSGSLPAKTQRELFGRFLGKGRITINGERETISHTRKVCFGTDYETTARVSWRSL